MFLFRNTVQSFGMVFDPAGFTIDNTGVYHAKVDCWQAYVGYCYTYDFVFDKATDMLAEQFEFKYGGQNHIIWTWKGDYLNLGAGGEVGIYKSLFKNGRHLYYVDKSLAMTMALIVINKKNVRSLDDLTDDDIVFTYAPDEKQWWITGFNPKFQNTKAKDLSLFCWITFNDSAMFNDFYKIYSKSTNKKSKYWVLIKDIDTALLFF